MIGLAMMLSSTFVTGTELDTLCTSKNPNDQLFCGAYIIGAADGIDTGVVAFGTSEDNDKICIPPGVIRKDVIDLTKTYLRESKLDHDVTASVFVFGALVAKWRCPAPQG